MPIINNIPPEMIEEHINWHSRPGNPSAGGRVLDPFPPIGPQPAQGSGEEFLVWHQGYIERFRNWVQTLPNTQQPDPDSISAWSAIPQMLKMGSLGWNARLASEEREINDIENFQSLDELGGFLEWSLHGFLHNAASNMWSEPVLLSFESPRSTFFWQLHGLIDSYRQAWLEAQQPAALPTGIPELAINGAAIQTDIGTPGEVDRFKFSIPTSGRYIIETSGPSDVVLYVGGPDNHQILHSQNDNGGQNFNAKIESNFPEGDYMAYVVLYNRSQTGNYEISVRN